MIDYLRVSVTDRCNLECSYCTPGQRDGPTIFRFLLSCEEIVEIASIAASFGITKLRMTGGEPLIRRDIGRLLRSVSDIEGLKILGITTNGTLLRQRLDDIEASSFRHVNISLDTLDPRKYEALCGSPGLSQVIRGVDEAISRGLHVKINTVCWAGFDVSDAIDLAGFSLDRGIDIRFIEAMRVPGVRTPDNFFHARLEDALRTGYTLVEPTRDGAARMFLAKGRSGRIGFITPSRAGFCEGCGRLRLSSTGLLRTCLFNRNGIDVQAALRGGGRQAVESCFRRVMLRKVASEGREGDVVPSMVGIGG